MSNELLPGTILYEHYKISECISTAEFSNIYIAEHLKENNKKVIIKELLHKAIGTNDRAKALEKFQEELDIYKKLDHPNMAKVIESFSSESAVYTENKQFIVMEYIEGKTLRKIKEEQKEDLSPDDAGKWFGQIMEAIKYLSEQNPPVVFYYFTPDHVMVTDEGQIKLINFGLGRFFRTGPFKSNQYMGIAGYAAPEQYGIKPVDNRADIFGAGAVIYYMLTQDDPEKHALNFSPVRTLNQMVSMQFARFISKCVQMKAEERCEHINEVIEKLNSITFTDAQVSPDKIKKKEEDKTRKPIERKIVGKEVSGLGQNLIWTLEKYIPVRKVIHTITIIVLLLIIALIGYKFISSDDKFPEHLIYAAQQGADIVILDMDKKEVFKTLPTGECKGKMIFLNNKIFVSGPVSNVIILDTKKGNIEKTLNAGNNSLDLIVTKDGNIIYASNPASNQITKLTIATKNSTSIGVGEAPTGLTLSENEHYLYVANFNSNNISVIDTTNNTGNQTINNVGTNPKKLLMLPGKNILYCLNWNSSNISIINTANNSVSKHLTVGQNPSDIVYKHSTKTVYVSNNRGKSITIVDAEQHQVKSEIKLTDIPSYISLSRNERKLFISVSNNTKNDNKLLIIDTEKNELLNDTIPLEKYITSFSVID